MSKRRQQLPGDKLPLPQPRSPRELDEKILAYAQQRAPQRAPQNTRSWLPGWSAGLATASVVAVALFITQTQQPAPTLSESAQQPARQQYTEEAEVKASADKDRAPATSPLTANAEPRAKKVEMLAKKPQPEAAPAIGRAQRAAMEVVSGFAADSSADGASTADSSAASPPAPDQDQTTRMDDDLLQSRLRHCAALLEQGQAAQAQAAYQALRRECPACELPETLEQWLAGQAGTETH